MDQAQQLRNIIKQQQIRTSKANVITVTSGKGGVGKSTLSVNLAIALTQLGKKVIILDADFGLANVEVMLGIRPSSNLSDLLFRGKSLKEIITTGPNNIGFISGGSGIRELSELNASQIKVLSERLWELDDMADFIIIDTGAGISEAVLQFVVCSNQTLLVATPEPTSITDAYALLKIVSNNPYRDSSQLNITMISNRVDSVQEGKMLHAKLNAVVEQFLNVKLGYLGCVVNEQAIMKSVMEQKPITLTKPNSSGAKYYKDIARILSDEQLIADRTQRGMKQLFNNLMWYKRNK